MRSALVAQAYTFRIGDRCGWVACVFWVRTVDTMTEMDFDFGGFIKEQLAAVSAETQRICDDVSERMSGHPVDEVFAALVDGGLPSDQDGTREIAQQISDGGDIAVELA